MTALPICKDRNIPEFPPFPVALGRVGRWSSRERTTILSANAAIQRRGSGKTLVSQAARGRFQTTIQNRSSNGCDEVSALGDHRIRCSLAIRALAISSTQPSARDVEIGSLER
jgi:hypothetical protein